MARLHIVIPDELDRELDLLCVNKSELARRGLLMALAEVKKNLGVALKAANDPAPGISIKQMVSVSRQALTATPTASPTPNLDDLIERAMIVNALNEQISVLNFEQICEYLEVDREEAANDMISPPEYHTGRNWVTKDQVLEICTLSPHPAKAESLKQWA